MKFLAATIAWATLSSLAVAGVAPLNATFTPIGDLPGGTFSSQPSGVSNDGKVVVGFSRATDGNEAFRWTQSTGMVGLGDFPEGSYDSRARGVSGDGSVVVGIGNKASFINDAFRWTAEDGLVGLGDLPGGSVGSEAFGVSADGEVVVGTSVMGTPILGPNIHAFRWTKSSNTMTDLGTLNANEGGASIANDVSGDGTAVVGYSSWVPGNQAIRWTQGTDMVGLGDLDGGAFASEAFAVSFDGSVVVGHSTSGNGNEAFRWTQATGMVGLSDLPGGSFYSSARAVSADGSIVVGYGTPANQFRAMIWDPINGMRNLQTVLTNEYGLGAALTGWTLGEASAISANGQYIVGYAINPTGGTEGWLVNLAPEEPTILLGDFNGDRHVDAADYTVWRDNLDTDFNLSGNGDEEGASAGTVDQGDYVLWRKNFGTSGLGSVATQAPEPSTLLLAALTALALLAARRRS